MIFSNKKKTTDVPFRVDDGVEIYRVGEVKFLGVVIDERLTWKSQINDLKIQIAKSIALL